MSKIAVGCLSVSGLAAIAFVVLAVLVPADRMLNLPYTVLTTYALTLVLIPIFVLVAFSNPWPNESEQKSVAINFLAMLLGVVAGLGFAAFWVPYDTIDAKLYGQIGASVALIFSGYVVAKVDKVVSQSLGAGMPPAHVLIALALGVGALVLTALVVVTSRVTYLQELAENEPHRAVLKARGELESARAKLAEAYSACQDARTADARARCTRLAVPMPIAD